MQKNNIVNYLLAINAILRSYALLGINLDKLIYMLMSFCFVKEVTRSMNRIYVLIPWLWLSIYCLIIVPLLTVALFSLKFSMPVFVAILFIVLSTIYNHGKLDVFIKIYRFFVLFSCFYFFFQEFTYNTTGIRISGLIPFLDNIYTSKSNITTSVIISKLSTYNRSASLFLEPAHFVQFISPFLIISLFSDKYKSIRDAIIITIVLIMSRSGNGLFLLGIIYTNYFFRTSKNRWVKYLILGVLIVPLFYFSNTIEGQLIFQRTAELDTNIDEVNSGFIRIYRGFYIWDEQSYMQKLFGVGDNLNYSMSQALKYQWMFRGNNDMFFNGIQNLLLSYGLIGLTLFLFAMYRLYKCTNTVGKVSLLAFVGLCFIESIYNTTIMILYVGIAILYLNDKYAKTTNYPCTIL